MSLDSTNICVQCCSYYRTEAPRAWFVSAAAHVGHLQQWFVALDVLILQVVLCGMHRVLFESISGIVFACPLASPLLPLWRLGIRVPRRPPGGCLEGQARNGTDGVVQVGPHSAFVKRRPLTTPLTRTHLVTSSVRMSAHR